MGQSRSTGLKLHRLSKALLKFGAPSHRIEDLLLRAAKELDVEAQILYQPGAATVRPISRAD